MIKVQQIPFFILGRIRWFLRVFLASMDRFYWEGGFAKAASLAYSSLVSFVPAVGFAFGTLASFAVSSQYVPGVRRFIFEHFVPVPETVDAIVDLLGSFSETLAQVQVTVVFFIVLTSIFLLNTIENTLNEIWQVYEPRSIPNKVAIFCSILVIAPVLAISIYYFTKFRVEPMLADFSGTGVVSTTYRLFFPLAVDFLAFLSLYTLVPRAAVSWRSACAGALVATLLFGLAKWGFAHYIESFSSYSRLYGTIAVVPIFLVWLYLAWGIVIFGAECAFQCQYLPESGRVIKRSLLTIGEGRVVLAVQSLVLLAYSFRSGKGMPDELELGERLGCSTAVLRPVLDVLEREKIVSRSASLGGPLSLLRNPSSVKIESLRNALFRSTPEPLHGAELARMYRCFEKKEKIDSVTLEDLLMKVDESHQA